jgi:hypothetical protein
LACKPSSVVKKNISRKKTSKIILIADLTKCLFAMRVPFELLELDRSILYKKTGFKTVRFCLRAPA